MPHPVRQTTDTLVLATAGGGQCPTSDWAHISYLIHHHRSTLKKNLCFRAYHNRCAHRCPLERAKENEFLHPPLLRTTFPPQAANLFVRQMSNHLAYMHRPSRQTYMHIVREKISGILLGYPVSRGALAYLISPKTHMRAHARSMPLSGNVSTLARNHPKYHIYGLYPVHFCWLVRCDPPLSDFHAQLWTKKNTTLPLSPSTRWPWAKCKTLSPTTLTD